MTRIARDEQVRRPLVKAATPRPKLALPRGAGVKGDGMTREKPKLPGLGDGGQTPTANSVDPTLAAAIKRGMSGVSSSPPKPERPAVVRADEAFARSELEKQAAGSRATTQYSEQVNAALLADPRIKATYEGLKALGYARFLPDVGELADVFSTTDLEPEDLLKHYGLLIQSRGGDENRVAAAGHGAEFRNMAEGLAPRLHEGLYGKPAWSTDADAANPVKPSARPESKWKGVAFDPLERAGLPRSAPKSYDAQQAKWDRSFGKAKRAAAGAKEP